MDGRSGDYVTPADCPTEQELIANFSQPKSKIFDLGDTMVHESSFIFVGSYNIADKHKGKAGTLYIVFDSRHHIFNYVKMDHALDLVNRSLKAGNIKSGSKPCSYVIYDGQREFGHEKDYSDMYIAPKAID